MTKIRKNDSWGREAWVMNWEEYMEAPNELDMTFDDFDDEDQEGRYGRMGEFEDLEDGVIEDELEEDDEDLDTAALK